MNRRALNPVSYLVERRYPHPFGSEGTAPDSSEYNLEFKLADSIAYEAELRQLPQDRIEDLVRGEKRAELLEKQLGHHVADKDSELVQPATDADFDFWARMAFWKPSEGIALICGREPDAITKDGLGRALDRGSPFAKRFVELMVIAERAREAWHLHSQDPPAYFMAWVEKLDLPYPPDLAAAVARFAESSVDWRARYQQLEQQVTQDRERIQAERESAPIPRSRELKTRERETVLKIMLGMAMRGYGWQPSATRSDAIVEICSDLDSIGLTVHADTIRKFLREATDLLPREIADSRDP